MLCVGVFLDGMLRASFRFVLSEALLAEYRHVLLRPKLSKLHGLAAAEVDQILTDVALHAIVWPAAPQMANSWRQTLATSFYGTCWQVATTWCWSQEPRNGAPAARFAALPTPSVM